MPPQFFVYKVLEAATNEWAKGELLGWGGYGEVFRGSMKSGSAAPLPVAIKRALPQHDEMKALTDWVKEARLMDTSDCPSLIPLLGMCWDGPRLCLVMPLMAGGSLADHLGRGGGGGGGALATDRKSVV